MTDKKIILNFLNRNYTVQLSDKFLIYDKVEHSMVGMESFYSQMVIILGDFGKGHNNTLEIVRKWVSEQKEFLVKDLHSFIKSVDLTMGFDHISEKMLTKYLDNFTYNKSFMLEYASEYYNERVILPKLKKHVKYLKNLDSHKLTYDKTISDFETQMKFEGFKQQEFVREYLLKWYKDTIIDKKIDDLLSQLIVTLGPRNWKVIWVGHGELNRPKIESIFGSQSPSMYGYIMDRYDIWYDGAVEKATEKLITSNHGGF